MCHTDDWATTLFYKMSRKRPLLLFTKYGTTIYNTLLYNCHNCLIMSQCANTYYYKIWWHDVLLRCSKCVTMSHCFLLKNDDTMIYVAPPYKMCHKVPAPFYELCYNELLMFLQHVTRGSTKYVKRSHRFQYTYNICHKNVWMCHTEPIIFFTKHDTGSLYQSMSQWADAPFTQCYTLQHTLFLERLSTKTSCLSDAS